MIDSNSGLPTMNSELAQTPPRPRPISVYATSDDTRPLDYRSHSEEHWREKLAARQRQVDLADDTNRHAKITAMHLRDEAQLKVSEFEARRKRVEDAAAAAFHAIKAARAMAVAAHARQRAIAVATPQAYRNTRTRRVRRSVVRLAAKSTADPGDSDPAPAARRALTDINVCSRGAL